MWIQTCSENAREVHDEEMDDTYEKYLHVSKNLWKFDEEVM